jgi:hypothetical protein
MLVLSVTILATQTDLTHKTFFLYAKWKNLICFILLLYFHYQLFGNQLIQYFCCYI